MSSPAPRVGSTCCCGQQRQRSAAPVAARAAATAAAAPRAGQPLHARPLVQQRRGQRHAPSAAAREALVAQQDPALAQAPLTEFLGVRDGGMQTVRGVLHSAADAAEVYRLLTDYDACSRVFSTIAASRTLRAPDGSTTVVQACRWAFLTFSGTFDVSLAVDEQPDARRLVFSLMQPEDGGGSAFMRDFQGVWQIEPLPDGGCVIEHELSVAPRLAIPAAIAPMTARIFRQQVAGLLDDLAAELQRQLAAVEDGGGTSMSAN